VAVPIAVLLGAAALFLLRFDPTASTTPRRRREPELAPGMANAD